MGLGFPADLKGPTEEGSLASLSRSLNGGDGADDATIATFDTGGDLIEEGDRLPTAVRGKSQHKAIKRIIVELLQCRNLPFLDDHNFHSACVVVSSPVTRDGPRGAATGEEKGGDGAAVESNRLSALGWHDNVLYFDSEHKAEVYRLEGDEKYDSSLPVSLQLVIGDQKTGDPVALTLADLVDSNELYRDYSVSLMGGEETAMLTLRSHCTSYFDER
tara:strand:- start:172 stop:822 length:651 start_codon:yes stop_codon:yes gene_type:complete